MKYIKPDEKRYYRLLSKKAKAIVKADPIWGKKSDVELSKYLLSVTYETKSIVCYNYLSVFSI